MSADAHLVDTEAFAGNQRQEMSTSADPPGPSPHEEQQPGRCLLQLDNTKAGMAAVDKNHVERIINDMSRGSPFYANEERKASQRRKRIARMKQLSAEFDLLPPHEHRAIANRVAAMVASMESDTNRGLGVFVHLDMDAFFAAVEEKKNPSLAAVPFGVGGIGMLSTSNYLARQYGVRAGMPGYIAKKLCPKLRFVQGSFDSYREESHRVRDVIREYDPNFSSGGLDEFTLNLEPYIVGRCRLSEAAGDVASRKDGCDGRSSDAVLDGEETPEVARRRGMLQTASEIAQEIRRRIVEATQLTASCGIAVTPCLAKIVSNYNKPNGQHLLPVYDKPSLVAFMAKLPVRRVPGIGKCTEEILSSGFDIHECGALLVHKERLQYCLTPKLFEFLLEVGLGVMGAFASQWGSGKDSEHAPEHQHQHEEEQLPLNPVEDEQPTASTGGGDRSNLDTRRPLPLPQQSASSVERGATSPSSVSRKTIGHERTFRPVRFPEELVTIAEGNLHSAHETLLEEHLLAQQISLKLKYTSFEVRQVSLALASPTSDVNALTEGMHSLLDPFLAECHKFRLLGVRLGQLVPASSGVEFGAAGTAVNSGAHSASTARPRPSPGPSLDELFARQYNRNGTDGGRGRGPCPKCQPTLISSSSEEDDGADKVRDPLLFCEDGRSDDDDDVVVLVPPVAASQRDKQHNAGSHRATEAVRLDRRTVTQRRVKSPGDVADVVVLS